MVQYVAGSTPIYVLKDATLPYIVVVMITHKFSTITRNRIIKHFALVNSCCRWADSEKVFKTCKGSLDFRLEKWL